MQLDEMQKILGRVEAEVRTLMDKNDASHDYQHVERVTQNATTLAAQEGAIHPAIMYRREVIILATLCHDVGDRKYLEEGQDGQVLAKELMLRCGADSALAETIQEIVNHVSYSHEIKNPQKVLDMIEKHPELAIVQDADRLDSLGPEGIARCFAYNVKVGRTLEDALRHFDEKLLKVGNMMKTISGRRKAAEETARLRTFLSWWTENQQWRRAIEM